MNEHFSKKELERQLSALCQEGKTIEAIKIYKEYTGASLKESKEFVEKFMDNGYVMPADSAKRTSGLDSVTKHELETKLFELCQKGKVLDAIRAYRDTTGEPLKESTEFVKKFIEKNNVALPKKGRCFVATACYGSYDAPEVLILRKYRDEKLLNTFLGSAFVRFYYAVSPSIARKLDKSERLKIYTRKFILGPFIKRIKLPE